MTSRTETFSRSVVRVRSLFRTRRGLRLAALALVALAWAAVSATAATTKTSVTWPTATQEIARSGISTDIAFCVVIARSSVGFRG